MIVLSIKDINPVGYKGQYPLYDVDLVKAEVHKNKAMMQIPLGHCNATQLISILKISASTRRSLMTDPNFPEPDGYYLTHNSLTKVPYYNEKKMLAWYQNEQDGDDDYTKTNYKDSPWTIPTHDKKQIKMNRMFRDVYRIFPQQQRV